MFVEGSALALQPCMSQGHFSANSYSHLTHTGSTLPPSKFTRNSQHLSATSQLRQADSARETSCARQLTKCPTHVPPCLLPLGRQRQLECSTHTFSFLLS